MKADFKLIFKQGYMHNVSMEEFDLWTKTNDMYPYIISAMKASYNLALDDAVSHVQIIEKCDMSRNFETIWQKVIDSKTILELKV